MASFDKKTLNHLQRLCRIQCTPEEEQEILSSLSRVLSYVDLLNEIDTSETLPCSYVLQDSMTQLTRNDEVKDLLSREFFLNNAPDHVGGMIRVPPILKTT